MIRRLAIALLLLTLAGAAAGATSASFLQTESESTRIVVDHVERWLALERQEPATGHLVTFTVAARDPLPEGAATVGVRLAVPAGLELEVGGDGVWQAVSEVELAPGETRAVAVRLAPDATDVPADAALYVYAAPPGEQPWLRFKRPVDRPAP